MIILPQKYQSKLFMPVPERQWRAPSLAQPKDEFGNPDMTRFRVRARQRLHDGFVRTIWTGWFDSRDDFDAFSWSLAKHLAWGEPMPRADWDLPSPGWVPGMGELLEYDFATLVFLTTTTGSNQTYTSPSDWNNSSNTVETVGAGGSGGYAQATTTHGTGGGGGAWNSISNFTFATPGTTTATRRLGTGGAGVTGDVAGNTGGDTWFNGTTLGGSSVGSKGGVGGAAGNNSQNGGAGGTGASGVGTSSNNGGRGGNLTGAGGSGGSGGGGAAGGAGAGNTGVDSSSTAGNVATNGGSGDAGSGGSAGTSGGGAGGAGTEWDATHGSGGGGGGLGSGASNSGAGGNYGGGSGGAKGSGAGNTGAGKQGIIVLTYTPASGIVSTNSPMLGM